MKSLFLLLLPAFSFAQGYINYDLRDELKQMANNDQYVGQQGNTPSKIMIGYDSVIVSNRIVLDSIHNPRLHEIFMLYGYPDNDLVTSEGAENFWLLVQHQDMDTAFQKQILGALKKKVALGKASKHNLAYLTDRVLINTGKQQLYGTQLDSGRKDVHQEADQILKQKGRKEPVRLFEPGKVDARRISMGLDSLEKYLEWANRHIKEMTKREE